MKQKRPWIVFYSHTGKEVKDICKALNPYGWKGLGVYPHAICSNNPNVSDLGRYSRNNHCIVLPKWSSDKYRKVFDEIRDYYKAEPLITLHGWMKIVPPDICNDYEIYNGHPALINEYPELKGKDIQEAVINEVEKYPFIGSVVHKCIPEVDSGEILEVEKVQNFRVVDKQLIYDILRNTSLITWLRFLPKKLYETDII